SVRAGTPARRRARRQQEAPGAPRSEADSRTSPRSLLCNRLEVLRDAPLVRVRHALAAACAKPILSQRARKPSRNVRLIPLERAPDVLRQGLPRRVVLLERFGARRRAAPLVLLGCARAVHHLAGALQLLVIFLPARRGVLPLPGLVGDLLLE